MFLNRGIPKEGSVASKIAKAVEEARAHKRWREEYKSMINVLDFERREARREGLEEGMSEEDAVAISRISQDAIDGLSAKK